MRRTTPPAARSRHRALSALLGLLLLSPLATAQTVDRDPSDQTPGPTVPIRSVDEIPDDVLQTVTLLLSSIHGVPDRATFEATVPAAREVLMALALDRDALPWHRPAALWALAHWADDDVLAVYRAVLAENDERLTHHTLILLGRTFGERAVSDLASHLNHADLQVRLSAIAALGEVATESSLDVLTAALQSEASAVARERIAGALQHVR